MIATGLPSRVAVPVTTPSAGSPSASTLAKRPSSVNEPASATSAIRSLANIFPLAAADWWYLAAPPRSTRSLSAPTSGSEESTVSVTLAERTASVSGGRRRWSSRGVPARRAQPFVLDQLEQPRRDPFHVRDLGQHDLGVLARRLHHERPAAQQPVQR